MVLITAIFDYIRHFDQNVLFYINQVFSNQLFDTVMPWLRESTFWLPLYIFFFAFAPLNYGKNGFIWLLFFLLTVAGCDQLSGFFKQHFHRLRPCNDPFMIEYIKLRMAYCSPSYSFTSNHAANHFGLAVFIHGTFKKANAIPTSWLYLWAVLVCYAQIYIGIHYPTDIIGGGLIGVFIGSILAAIFNRYIRLQATPGKISPVNRPG